MELIIPQNNQPHKKYYGIAFFAGISRLSCVAASNFINFCCSFSSNTIIDAVLLHR